MAAATEAQTAAGVAPRFIAPGLWRLLAERWHRPLPRLGARNAGVLFAAVTWVPLALLSWMDGRFAGDGWVLSRDVAAYVRFLAAGPLLLVVGAFADRELAKEVASWRASELVPRERQSAWDAFMARTAAMKGSARGPLLALAASYALSAIAVKTAAEAGQESWLWAPGAPGPLSWAGWWYALVSAPLLYHALLRWLWRFGLWTASLGRLTALPLRPLGTHADGVGGLDALARTHMIFVWLVGTVSALEAGALANTALHRGVPLDDLRRLVILLASTSLVIFVGPVLMFTPALLTARRRAAARYGAVAAHHAADLEAHISEALAADQRSRPLLSGDLLENDANLAQSFATLRTMRVFLLSRSSLLLYAIVAAAPLFLVGLTESPARELLSRLKALLM
jgi:hypothetical protein